ncbi:MAG: aldo/keto reductase [Candidatus Margulisiibacteriota bacterium]
MSPLFGHATSESTQAIMSRFPQLAYHVLGKTGLRVSSVGMGTYRITAESETHRQALMTALTEGVNLIDTSSNYADGLSEKLIGLVLKDAIERDIVSRDEVVVVSKGGYIQGENFEHYQIRISSGRPFPEVVDLEPGLAHCIHPDFLAEQLERSLQRLQLETLDVYLLHNPEYYLTWAQREGHSLAGAREVYYQRIEQALSFLESQVQKGRIRWYGISSNTFGLPAQAPMFTSLERIFHSVDVVGARHFAVVQFPLNLLETGAMTQPNQSRARSVLDLAHSYDLGVLINRPLNAIQGNVLMRLVEVETEEFADEETVRELCHELSESEDAFLATLAPHLFVDDAEIQAFEQRFFVGSLVVGSWAEFSGYHHWQEFLSHVILPRVEQAVDFITQQQGFGGQEDSWLDGYLRTVKDVVSAISTYHADRNQQFASQIKEKILSAHPDWELLSLAQMAIRTLRTTPGVSSVLVGMRTPDYVNMVLDEQQNTSAKSVADATLWHRLSA